jgi:serine/threonine protein phosphatase PrpC
MHITATHPPEYDKPRLLLAVTDCLAKMHETGQVHGNVTVAHVREWMDDRGCFDPARFVNARRPEAASSGLTDFVLIDLESYCKFSIELISGFPAADNAVFKADNYRGLAWNSCFLKTLEELSQTANFASVSMLSFLNLLKANPVLPVEISHTRTTPPRVQPKFNFQLRNGTVGRPYLVEAGALAKAIAKQWGDNLDTARVINLQIPDNSGLEFNPLDGSIMGVPSRALEENLHVEYQSQAGARSIPLSVKLLINPDPSSLWKDLPSPADAPYPKDATAHSESVFGSFRVVAASRRGRSHANKGDFRDDDFAVGYSPETGWLVVAVADGAGSAKYSRRGSQLACAVARNQLVGTLNQFVENPEETAQDWSQFENYHKLRKALYEAALLAHHELAKEANAPQASLSQPPTLRNFDTTLILMAIKATADGYVGATFAIGDGGAGILNTPDAGQPLTRADSGEHAGQTTFLTFPSTLRPDEENLAKRFSLVVTPQLTAALVMTDGITDPKFPSDAAYADPVQWSALWQELQPALGGSADLLDWMNFFSPGNHDDRTLVVVQPAAATTPLSR